MDWLTSTQSTICIEKSSGVHHSIVINVNPVKSFMVCCLRKMPSSSRQISQSPPQTNSSFKNIVMRSDAHTPWRRLDIIFSGPFPNGEPIIIFETTHLASEGAFIVAVHLLFLWSSQETAMASTVRSLIIFNHFCIHSAEWASPVTSDETLLSVIEMDFADHADSAHAAGSSSVNAG